MSGRRRVVWSSDPAPSAPDAQPTFSAAARPLRGTKQVARLLRTRKGRGGKVVTLIEGLVLAASEREALASELRRACGVGGTVRGDAIELQGDLRERPAELLTERGYLVKLVGG